MKMRLLYSVLVLFVGVLGSCSKEESVTTNSIEAKNAPEVENELLDAVNDHRVSMGYTILEFSPVAYEYANSHTDYMISKGSINHDNFNSRASNIASAVEAQNVAENVAKNYSNAVEAFNGWYNSSSHKKTMEGDFTHTAVSVKQNSNGDYYFTQLFYKK